MFYIGTSGFSFKDWIGTVYPETLSAKETLPYYEKKLGFNAVEINASYYALLSDKSFASMSEKTSPGFQFVVKSYRGITHDPFDDRLGSKMPSLQKAKEDAGKFIYSVQPLKTAGKLGAVLLQFPVFFRNSTDSKDYILACREQFGEIPLVAEFRNRSWAAFDTADFLARNGIAYCAVDEPKLQRLMPFINQVTSGTGYMRFHGRNLNWFNTPAEERYNYLYSSEELEGFVPELKKMAQKAKKTFIFFNNCHAGSAARNALKMKELLGI